MEWGFFFLLIFIGAPIARAVGRNIERRGLPRPEPDRELRDALRSTEQRLSDSETRLATLEERLDFYEKLLANPEKRQSP